MPPPSPSALQLLGQLGSLGLSLVFALAIGFGVGYWLDLQLGTRPWLMFIGFFFGVAAAVLNIYRVMKLSDQANARR
jgi:F0F1-type ATP synthase assembly protein I